MPLISVPVEFSEEALALIAAKKADPLFSHESWGDPDLGPVRREARDHYRNVQRLTCAYCRGPVASGSATGAPVEHIVPKATHVMFTFEPKNLCVVCPDCNEYKRSRAVTDPVMMVARVRYPTSSDLFKIVHPHFDEYDHHIVKANRIYVGLTQKGGYTVYICNLNRFFRRFGRCDELVEDLELIQQSQRFYNDSPMDI
jgi:hypothetical protein